MTDTKHWPLRPRPLDGESLNSWFTRLAHANGVVPIQLLRCVLPGSIPSPRDLDRMACDKIIANLAQHTGVRPDKIESMIFSHWQEFVPENDNGRGVLPWFLPVMRGESRRDLGHQFCPECLAEDEVPYMRLTWRLSFIAICPRHKTLLSRHCPECHAPVTIHDLTPDRNLSQCSKCGKSLINADRHELQEWTALSLAAQDGLLRTTNKEEILLGRHGAVSSADFLYVKLRLLQVLTSRTSALPLRAHIATAVGWNFPPASIPRLRQFHLLNSRCRAILVAMSWWLAQDWPYRFVKACKASGITSRDLLKRRQSAPYVFEEPVRKYLMDKNEQTDHTVDTDLSNPKEKPYPKLSGQCRYWKLDGVSSDIREAAKVAAHMQGENIGPWVDKVLREKLKRDSLS